MILDLPLNILNASLRLITLIFSSILLFNLTSDLRRSYQDGERNGVWHTRIALMMIMLALVFENFIYLLAYFHGEFRTKELNEWLNNAKPFVSVSRFLIAYATIILYQLFKKGRKK